MSQVKCPLQASAAEIAVDAVRRPLSVNLQHLRYGVQTGRGWVTQDLVVRDLHMLHNVIVGEVCCFFQSACFPR